MWNGANMTNAPSPVGLMVLHWRIKAILPTETYGIVETLQVMKIMSSADKLHTSSAVEDESQWVLKKTQESGLHLSPDSAMT